MASSDGISSGKRGIWPDVSDEGISAFGLLTRVFTYFYRGVVIGLGMLLGLSKVAIGLNTVALINEEDTLASLGPSVLSGGLHVIKGATVLVGQVIRVEVMGRSEHMYDTLRCQSVGDESNAITKASYVLQGCTGFRNVQNCYTREEVGVQARSDRRFFSIGVKVGRGLNMVVSSSLGFTVVVRLANDGLLTMRQDFTVGLPDTLIRGKATGGWTVIDETAQGI